ncbi:hypothetical protein C8R46DRAFT_1284951 [Mycena filopes]|nr:hypothetical protein C8R46DRAFT_1284951 [Mycena filopes]
MNASAAALKEQEELIRGLETTAKQNAARISALEQKTLKERKEHETLRDSTARRFAAKVTGRKEKFEAKASKEERCALHTLISQCDRCLFSFVGKYVEALEKEVQEKRQQANLETMIHEAKAVRNDLLSKVQVYNTTKQKLEALYHEIFDGPTQAYPEDDQLEERLRQAQDFYNDIQAWLNRASQSTAMLQSADSALQSCSRALQEALNYSEWDTWGGGTFTDMMERNALSSAEGFAMQAATYVQQAQIADPQVQPIGEISIARGSFVSDVLFDNIFTDLAFHKKIKASALNLEAVHFNLKQQLNLARSRAGAIGADLNGAADALARARAALDAFRRHVFDELAGNGNGNGNSPPVPAYDAPAYSADPPMMPRAPEPIGSYPPPGGFSPPAHPPPGGFSPPCHPPPGGFSPPAHPPHIAHAPQGGPSAYTPPPGPPPPGAPPSGTSSLAPSPPVSPPRAAVGLPRSPKPTSTTPSYAPPLGPPPPGSSRAASPSAWGSRNPYAAALASPTTSSGGPDMKR